LKGTLSLRRWPISGGWSVFKTKMIWHEFVDSGYGSCFIIIGAASKD
jgi:hypothetical protein